LRAHGAEHAQYRSPSHGRRLPSLLDALSGKENALATTGDLYDRKAFLVIGSDLAQQHPFLSFQIRANFRHHEAHVYTVTPGPVREDKYAVASVVAAAGEEFKALEGLRDRLKAEPDLVILFGDAIKGDAVRQLVAFGDSLGIPLKYVCLVDYSNSRGAADMGLLPDLGPGYHASGGEGLAYDEILSAADLDVLWVVGGNPLQRAPLASEKAFVVLHEMFLTETAQRADVIFPAASAYEKSGTVTNVCGEVQRLKAGPKFMGTKTDLEIFGLIAKEMGLNLGIWLMNFLMLSLIKAAVVAFVLLTTLAYLQWIERKVIAHIQVRVGPSRVGPHGLLQPLADVIKLITKEDLIPPHVNKLFYLARRSWPSHGADFDFRDSLRPGDSYRRLQYGMQLTDLNIGVLFILAVSSNGVYGIALAGWASNNKYSLLGGLRSSAQMISYELPMALAIAAPLLMRTR
jgi:hypothetical protein